MSFSGSEALKAFEEALRDIRREEDDIARRLSRTTELVTKMRQQESDLLRQLALLRLDMEARAKLDSRFDRVQAAVRQAMQQHGGNLASTGKRLQALDKAISVLATERAQLRNEAEKLQADLEALAATTEPLLMKDSGFAAHLRAASEVRALAQASLSKLAQAQADRELKERRYRSDPLFMYLWEGNYGTAQYRASGVTAWLDGQVARLIGFARARALFATLNEIPVRLRRYADQMSERAAAAENEVAVIRNSAIDAAGGGPLREALAEAWARMAAIDAEIVVAEDERGETVTAQRELALGDDPEYSSSIQDLIDILNSEDVRLLLESARAERDEEGDTIVMQIDDVRQRVLDEEGDRRDQRARLRTLTGRRRELEDITYEFKRVGLDDPQSRYEDGTLIGDRLNDFLKGGISATAYWDQWRVRRSLTAGPPAGTPDGALPAVSGDAGPVQRLGRSPDPEGGADGRFSRPRSGPAGRRPFGAGH